MTFSVGVSIVGRAPLDISPMCQERDWQVGKTTDDRRQTHLRHLWHILDRAKLAHVAAVAACGAGCTTHGAGSELHELEAASRMLSCGICWDGLAAQLGPVVGLWRGWVERIVEVLGALYDRRGARLNAATSPLALYCCIAVPCEGGVCMDAMGDWRVGVARLEEWAR
jgi:hypothetical protein